MIMHGVKLRWLKLFKWRKEQKLQFLIEKEVDLPVK